MENDGLWPSTFDRGTVESASEIGKLDGSSTVLLQPYNVFWGVVHVQACGDATSDSRL